MMHKLIIDLWWLNVATYLKVDFNQAKRIVENAYNDINNTDTFTDYSEQIIEVVKVYSKHKDLIDV